MKSSPTKRDCGARKIFSGLSVLMTVFVQNCLPIRFIWKQNRALDDFITKVWQWRIVAEMITTITGTCNHFQRCFFLTIGNKQPWIGISLRNWEKYQHLCKKSKNLSNHLSLLCNLQIYISFLFLKGSK